MWPGISIVPFMSRGATDRASCGQRGFAATALDSDRLVLEKTRGAHGIDERIPVGSLRSGVEFLHRLVLALAARDA